MSRAIVVAFHKYTPFGGEYYEPLLDFFLAKMREYKDEYDKLYICDSNWNIDPKKFKGLNVEVIRTNPHLRYYDTYKHVLPQIKEDLVLFMDNDMVVYKPGRIKAAFLYLEPREKEVVSIFDTIGSRTFPELNGKSKICPYWFAVRTKLLMQFRDCEWGPVYWGETLSELTLKMIEAGVKFYEWQEDKNNILFDGTQDGEGKSFDLGYYHVRAGSTPAYLLATKKYGNIDTYNDYLKNQPKSEYLRQCAWYQYMGGNPYEIVKEVSEGFDFKDYYEKFLQYHCL
jgi:hypothetical protein